MNHSLTGDRLRRRLKTIGLSDSLARTVSSRVSTQVAHMGPEGATIYLKRVGDALLHHLVGTPEKPPWVKTINGFPKFFTGCEDLPEAVLIRLAKVARAIRLSEVSEKQVRKVRDAVVKPYSGSEAGVADMTSFVKEGLSFYGFDKPENRTDLDYFKPVRPIARQFSAITSVSGVTDSATAPDLVTPVRVLRNVPELRALPYWQDIFYPVSPITLAEVFHPDRNRDKGHAVGEIHAAQEGGAKLRMFASPYTVVQTLLYPIHYWIADNFNKATPTICTYDQKSGADWAKRKLEAGVTVYSWDLSTATCRFPLQPQLEMLRIIGLPYECIDALRWACRGTWKVGHELQSMFRMKEVAWTVGQPLGIAPSMSMFTLCHAMLLTGISRKYGRDPEQVFRILGDDVVISDEMVSSEYTRVLRLCDVGISLNKSHASADFAEFAGYSITKHLQVRPGQYRQVQKKNYLELVEEFKTPLSDEVPSWMERCGLLHLFIRGEYDPVPSEWPAYLKQATLLVTSRLDSWRITEAPLWVSRVQAEYIDQWSTAFPNVCSQGWFSSLANYVGGRMPVAFYFPDIKPVWKEAFSPLRQFFDDDVVMSFMASSQHIGDVHYSVHFVNAVTCVFSLWERMLLDIDQTLVLIDEISERLHGLLWLPPSKTAVHKILLNQYRALAQLDKDTM